VIIPPPVPGLVIRYSFLWSNEARQSATEGRKDRPAAIVVAAQKADGRISVIVAPITHEKPSDIDGSLEVPAAIAKALGLDGDRQWLRFDELNRFDWPGFDLRPIPGQESCAYGMLPKDLYEQLREGILKRQRTRKLTQR